MQSIQQVFNHPRFQFARSALVQKLRKDEKNLEALRLGYTESWPAVEKDFDLIVLAFEAEERTRELHVGFLMKVEATVESDKHYRIYSDEFVCIGSHDRSFINDADFYGKSGPGGGARELIYKTGVDANEVEASECGAPPGMNERRLVWVRKNHNKFSDHVRRHWKGRCAVHDHECNGALIASHIYPWRACDEYQKTDRNNGLLLSVPLDGLFDRGLVSFDDDGLILISSKLGEETRKAFGVKKSMALRQDCFTVDMKKYLVKHRQLFGFD